MINSLADDGNGRTWWWGGDEVSELAFLNAFANRGKRRELDYQVKVKSAL